MDGLVGKGKIVVANGCLTQTSQSLCEGIFRYSQQLDGMGKYNWHQFIEVCDTADRRFKSLQPALNYTTRMQSS